MNRCGLFGSNKCLDKRKIPPVSIDFNSLKASIYKGFSVLVGKCNILPSNFNTLKQYNMKVKILLLAIKNSSIV